MAPTPLAVRTQSLAVVRSPLAKQDTDLEPNRPDNVPAQPLTASSPPTVSGLDARLTVTALSRSNRTKHHFLDA